MSDFPTKKIDWEYFCSFLKKEGFIQKTGDCPPPSERFLKEMSVFEHMNIKLDVVTNPDEDNASFEIMIDQDGIVKTIYSGFNQNVLKGYFLMMSRVTQFILQLMR